MATVLASSFFLLGTVLLYHVTGTLNIDEMIAHRDLITGPIGATALLLVLSCLIIELKPFPANGWGLDVYETASSGVAALISVGVSAGVFFALFKLLPLFENHLDIIAVSGGVTFLFSNLVGLRQTNVQRMLGYSSIAQMGLLMLALALLHKLGAEASMPLVVGGLFVNHLFAKAGLFWLAGAVERTEVAGWSAIAGRPLVLLVLAVLLVAIAGLPPFPGFWAKWELVMQLSSGRAIWLDRRHPGGVAARGGLHVRLVQAGERVPCRTRRRSGLLCAHARTCHDLRHRAGCERLLRRAHRRRCLVVAVCAALRRRPALALDWLPGRVKCTLMLAGAVRRQLDDRRPRRASAGCLPCCC